MKINKSVKNDILIFQVMEDITNQNPQELYNHIFTNLSAPSRNIVLDLEKVNYINSFALGILIKIQQDLGDRGFRFYLWKTNTEVNALLKVTRVIDRFSIIKSLEDIKIKSEM